MVINLLQESADLVISPSQGYYLADPTGWADNKPRAIEIVERSEYSNKFNFSNVVFPEGGMFWMSQRLFNKLVDLKLDISNFEEEPIPQDGTTAHALERLIGALATEDGKRICQLHLSESSIYNKYYEDRICYRKRLQEINEEDRVRILAFFLPQFHETMQNNTWHGEGFTEWTNVKKNNPLFTGHYQQRVPHPDIGYYSVESKSYFENTQALMKDAGVGGLIFYHYWFSGSLIISEPSNYLLKNPGIEIDWCFCWANENWTRAWDGNEDQVLMRQEYSHEDARSFIQYLIPFFRDDRYLKVGKRPILMVYRPSHNPLMCDYVDIWRQECNAAGLDEPYLVCTLTRGAVNPKDYKFDIGLERILHDWTNGRVPQINDELSFYDSFGGSVLNYKQVADYYTSLNRREDFKLIRSIVPDWDNSPRYSSNAYLLHNSTPEVFSQWLSSLIDDTRTRLEGDERIIVINAWNEWAESAYLEPDSKYGYSFLNSVARSMLGIPYQTTNNILIHHLSTLRQKMILKVEIPDFILNHLMIDCTISEAFWSCISTGSSKHIISVPDKIYDCISANLKHLFSKASDLGCSTDDTVNIFFRRIEYIMPGSLDSIVKMAIAYPGNIIAFNSVQYTDYVISRGHEFSIDSFHLYANLGIIVTTSSFVSSSLRARICPVSISFPSAYLFLEHSYEVKHISKVNTIVRFHSGGDIRLLKKALFSLFIMEGGSKVQPIVACQDCNTSEFIEQINDVIRSIPWLEQYEPIILHYTSSVSEPDCRARMLVEPLQHASNQFIAFLDHDDYMFPGSYFYLTSRLVQTGKAVSFGRIYVAHTDIDKSFVVEMRKDFDYGFSYSDFVSNNNAPLHSFMIDSNRVQLKSLSFIPGMKYLEDYYMTLQVFKADNCDWDSLFRPEYIGDYVYSAGSDTSGTLSISDELEREVLIASRQYLECEEHIRSLRGSLLH